MSGGQIKNDITHGTQHSEYMLTKQKRTRLRNRIWPYVVARKEFWNVPNAIHKCRKIANSDKEALHILICDHIGDFIYTMGYVQSLRVQTGYKRIILYVTEKFAKLLELYPDITGEVTILTPQKIYGLLLISSTWHGIHEYEKIDNLIVINPANAFSNGNFDYIVRYPNIIFQDCIRYGCLRLGKNSTFIPANFA